MTATSIEKKIGYTFKDKKLLTTALTHGSYAHLHGGDSYERMEYLGDALLDFIVAEALYLRFPKADEGELTKRRIVLVSEQPLAAASRRLGLESEVRVLAHHMGKDSVLSDGDLSRRRGGAGAQVRLGRAVGRPRKQGGEGRKVRSLRRIRSGEGAFCRRGAQRPRAQTEFHHGAVH